jgi:hypothetical protein
MLSLPITRYAHAQHTHIVVSVNLKIPIFFHKTQTVMPSLILPVRKLSIYHTQMCVFSTCAFLNRLIRAYLQIFLHFRKTLMVYKYSHTWAPLSLYLDLNSARLFSLNFGFCIRQKCINRNKRRIV